jgi:hypothetical protein
MHLVTTIRRKRMECNESDDSAYVDVFADEDMADDLAYFESLADDGDDFVDLNSYSEWAESGLAELVTYQEWQNAPRLQQTDLPRLHNAKIQFWLTLLRQPPDDPGGDDNGRSPFSYGDHDRYSHSGFARYLTYPQWCAFVGARPSDPQRAYAQNSDGKPSTEEISS